MGANVVSFYVQTPPIAQETANAAVSRLCRRGTGRWGVPLAAVTAFVVAAGASAALTVDRIDHGTAGAGARPAVASTGAASAGPASAGAASPAAIAQADLVDAVQGARG